MGQSRVPSIADVAALAAVSHQTVSRVVNGNPNVREQTRLRVDAAIAELGYRPNPAARALARGRGDLIGVVASTTTLFGPASMRSAVELSALQHGYGVTVASVDESDREGLTGAVNRLLDMRVRGIVAIAAMPASLRVMDALPAGFPLVLLDGDRFLDTATAGVDQVRGAELATQHLLDAGHDTVWHVAGPLESFDARDRVTGWQDTLMRAGREIPPPLNGNWTARSGYEAGRMLSRMKDVSAVFAGNDQMALGLIRSLAESGIRCPEDVSIVGFDDIPECAYFSPPLTTIYQDFQEVARRAMEWLIAHVEERPAPGLERVEPRLVERASVSHVDS